MNYTWAVTAVTSATVTDLSDVVINVKWSYTGKDDAGNEGVFNGATPLETKDIDPATFVPFDQLTEALVLSWVEPIVMGNATYWQHINDAITEQIAAKTANLNPNAPLPWNPPTPPTPPTPV
jgi:hypothetical protein